MKNIRVFYQKTGRLKYISHLDMNRVFTRISRRSGMPIWYTEGFNPHPRINFALPLSLGFESTYEAVDIRIDDDNYSNDEAYERLKSVMPDELKVVRVTDPVMKTGEIAFARFEISLDLPENAESFFEQGEIFMEKKTKKGGIKTVDIRPMINSYEIGEGRLELVLSAGTDNLNPTLVIDAMRRHFDREIKVNSVIRTMLYNKEMEKFI